MAEILNDEEIQKLFGTVIIGGESDCIRPNSYILRLGEEGEMLNSGKEFRLGRESKAIRVRPGHSVGLVAHEMIDFRREIVRKIYPDHDLHAFVSPTTDLSREGIVAPTTQVDAGYRGTLNWTIANTSNKPREFSHKEKLFRLTIFKLGNGETPDKPYDGDYQNLEGYVSSMRKPPRVGLKPSEWVDSYVEGGPEELLKNLINSGYPWDVLGECLKTVQNKFEIVTNEYSQIYDSINRLSTEVDDACNESKGIRSNMNKEISDALGSKAKELQTRWVAISASLIGFIIGLYLTIINNQAALDIIDRWGSIIGLVFIILCVLVFIWQIRK